MNKKIFIFIFAIFSIIFFTVFFIYNSKINKIPIKREITNYNAVVETVGQNLDQNESENLNLKKVIPIFDPLSRITKKPFGIFITPKNSPVQPEKFQGYHTGTDFETNPDEQNADVAVRALCDGKILMLKYATGYGGIIVSSCVLGGEDITVIYGHINLVSSAFKIGDSVQAEDFLANLGMGFSNQTDGERKHLHLGIHKGKAMNILGYVKNGNQLSDWVDPVLFLK